MQQPQLQLLLLFDFYLAYLYKAIKRYYIRPGRQGRSFATDATWYPYL